MHFRDRVASKYWYDTIQNTRYGCLEGYRSGKTLVFRGVPYGKAERWSLPEYPDAWDGVRDATLSGPMGIHVNRDGVLTGVEDCLNMDIYRPDTQQTGLPVMFFLHGGNNQIDGADQVDFTEFAYAANVIAISVNYRLGALGFNPLRAIKGEDPAQASGNFAILDAIRGLSWVRDNIVSFGGNPGNITIAGFSSGGRDVMELLISPDAKGYFQKAISFSGGMTTAEIEPSQKNFAEHLAPLVVEDHVKPYLSEAEEWLLSDAPEVRDYLLGLPAGRLAKAFGPAYIRMKEFPHLYPDGIVLDSMGFKSKTFTTVPLMMETGTDEFSIYAAQDPYFAPYVADRSILTNEKMRKEFEFAKKYGSAMYRLFNADAPASMLVGKYRAPILYTDDRLWRRSENRRGCGSASLRLRAWDMDSVRDGQGNVDDGRFPDSCFRQPWLPGYEAHDPAVYRKFHEDRKSKWKRPSGMAEVDDGQGWLRLAGHSYGREYGCGRTDHSA